MILYLPPKPSLIIQVKEVQAAEQAVNVAHAAEKNGDYQKCVDSAGEALGISTVSASLWQLRARCALGLGDAEGAVGDLTYFLSVRR